MTGGVIPGGLPVEVRLHGQVLPASFVRESAQKWLAQYQDAPAHSDAWQLPVLAGTRNGARVDAEQVCDFCEGHRRSVAVAKFIERHLRRFLTTRSRMT